MIEIMMCIGRYKLLWLGHARLGLEASSKYLHAIPALNCCLQGGIEDYDYPYDILTPVNEECSGLATDSDSTTLLQ